MNRRSFFGALAAVVAAGKAAPGILAKLATPTPTYPPGLLDVIQTDSIHGLSRGTYHQWAIIRNGELVTNAIGEITAIDQKAGTMTVNWQPHDLQPHDLLVRADVFDRFRLGGGRVRSRRDPFAAWERRVLG